MPWKQPPSQPWCFLTENPQAILDGLREAEFDHIYPASPTLFDRFLTYLDATGVRETFEHFPDPRQRRSIPVRFLTQALLVRPLFAVSSLAQLGPALAASPPVLHLLGFNAQQIEQGFRANANRRPFDEETLANFAAGISAEDCLAHGLRGVEKLLAAHPERFAEATVIVDSKAVFAPAGKAGSTGARRPAVTLKVCTLSLFTEGEAVPLVWLFAPEHEGDLRRQGLRVCIKLRQDRHLYADALGATRGRDVLRPRAAPSWQDAPPPKLKGKSLPRRQVLLVPELESWDSAAEPVDALVIRDIYPEGSVQEAVIACFGNTARDPVTLLAHWRSRWAIEEFFMRADRYQKLGRLFPCREGFARAWVHFAFLAHALLWFFDHYPPDTPLPEPKTAGLRVIRRPYYALIPFGQLLQIILDHTTAWQSKRSQVLLRLGVLDLPP